MELMWYLTVIRRSWRILLLSVVLPAFAAAVITLLLPPTYEAEAQLVLYRSKADVTFDPRFQTVTEDQSVAFNTPQDPRRQTLSALATSDEVISKTMALLPAAVANNWSRSELKEQVEVGVIGNLLRLTVQGADPEEAALVANVWAETAVTTANNIFRQEQSSDGLSRQVEAAWLDYEEAQEALESFLGENRIEQLNLEIAIIRQAVEDGRSVYQNNARDELAVRLSASERIPLLLQNAGALRHLLEGAESQQAVDFSTQAALFYLQVSALNNGVELPGELQLSLPTADEAPLTNAAAVRRLDRLTQSLTELQVQLEEETVSQSRSVLSGAGIQEQFSEPLSALQVELNDLNAALERETARERELETTRDLAWESYLTLSRKLSEVTITEQTVETEVVMAARAVPGQQPVGPNLLLNVGVALALGAFVGLTVVFLPPYLRGAGP